MLRLKNEFYEACIERGFSEKEAWRRTTLFKAIRWLKCSYGPDVDDKILNFEAL